MMRMQKRLTRSPMVLVHVIGCALFWLGYKLGRFSEKTAIQSITAENQQPKLKSKTNTSTQLQNETNTSTQLQKSHGTEYDRYPDQYSCVKTYITLQENHADPLSLLSFGSSTGREAKALANIYFNSPNDMIYGVDLDNKTLVKARWFTLKVPKGKITFFNGKRTPVSDFGPYDAIFANSVLCLNPPPSAIVKEFMKVFPFENFDKTVRELDQLQFSSQCYRKEIPKISM